MGWQKTRSKYLIALIQALYVIVGLLGVIDIVIEFGYWATGTSLFSVELSLMGNLLLSSFLLTTCAAARWTITVRPEGL